MEKQGIIKLFLKKGLQLDSKSLDFFHTDPNKIDIFLENLEHVSTTPIITPDFIQKTLHPQMANIEIIKKPVYRGGRVSAQEYAQYFSNRLDKISKILAKKLCLMNLVSIGKLGPKTRKFSVVGMVKDKDDEQMNVTIEDTTGSLSLHFDEKSADYKQIVLDEVIGAVCDQNEIVRASSIIWPDVPLRKTVAKTDKDIFCLFVSDLHMDDGNFKKGSYEKFLDWIGKADFKDFYVFILGDVSGDKKDLNNFFGDLPKNCHKIFVKGEIDPDPDASDLNLINPSLIKIEDLYILLSHGKFMEKYSAMWSDAPPEVVMLNLLKKRHINPIFDLNARICEEDPFLLDTVPDIFATGHFHTPSLLNYKGTTIISTGSFVSNPIFWLANLKTRETIKVDFA